MRTVDDAPYHGGLPFSGGRYEGVHMCKYDLISEFHFTRFNQPPCGVECQAQSGAVCSAAGLGTAK
jgi:hypothetical protein